MALGPVNVPGVSAYDLDLIKEAIISGAVTLPLATTDGEKIETVSGETIEAVRLFK